MSGKHFRTPVVRLVRLMSNVGEPHDLYMQRYTNFYYLQTFCVIFLENFNEIVKYLIKTAKNG